MSDSVAFRAAERFVLRAPLLPFRRFIDWSDGLQAPNSTGAALSAALAADREVLRQRLNRSLAAPMILDALRLTRPEAAERVGDYLTLSENKIRWWERKLARLFGRLTGRTAPLGLFATVSLGRVSDRTRLALGSVEAVRTKSRPTYESMYFLATELETHLGSSLRYAGPAAVYDVGTSVRCLRSRFTSGDLPHELVTFDHGEALDTALRIARGGCTREELVAGLVTTGFSSKQANAFTDELLEESLLRSDLRPPILDIDAVAWLRNGLARAPAAQRTETVRRDLEALTASLADLDAAPLGEKAAPFARTRDLVQALSPRARGAPIDVVAYRPCPDLTLGGAMLDELSRAVVLLHRLTPRREDSRLREFHRRFAARYGSQWIPLMVALDEEIGIGFPPTKGVVRTPPQLIRDLVAGPAPSTNSSLTAREAYLLERIAAGHPELVLDGRDLEKLAEPNPLPLPESFYMVASVADAETQAHERVILEGVGGPSAVRLWSRFCHADSELHQFVLDHLLHDVPPRADAVFAEVAHLPALRTAFAFQRPATHTVTIDISGAEVSPRSLSLSEIVVGVREGRVLLFAPRLGKELLPRLTAAHNVGAHGLSIDLFLLTLQEQECATPLSWEWGNLERLPKLPRVSSGRLVLRPAQWRITGDDLAFLDARDDATRFAALRRWRERWGVPRFVALSSSGLPVDLENVLCVEAMAHSLRRWRDESVREMLPSPSQLAASGPEGRYVHQIVVPFMSQRGPAAAILDPPTETDVRATFHPGSPWLSVKVYCADESGDELLCDLVHPVLAAAREAGWIDRWFFIRYTDPDFHLRVRFHGDGDVLLARVWPLFEQTARRAVEAGTIWRLEIDTYTRTSHTTGGASLVEHAETLFEADSEAALQCVGLRRSVADDERMVWLPAVMGVDALLADFGQDVPARIALLPRLRDKWTQHMGLGRESARTLTAIYRAERQHVAKLLDVASPEPTWQACAKIFALRSDSIRSVVDAYASLDPAQLAGALDTFIHLLVNRIVPSYANATEVAIYHLLAQHYEAERRRR